MNSTLAALFLINCLYAYSAYWTWSGGQFLLLFPCFILIGGYSVAWTAGEGAGLVPGMALGIALSACGGLLLLVLLRRLGNVYLAIVSFEALVVVQTLADNLSSITGSTTGRSVNASVSLTTLVVVVVAVSIAARQIDRSTVGLALRLVRADRTLASSFGVRIFQMDCWLLLASAVTGAVAGGLLGPYYGYISPTDIGFEQLILILGSVIVGGVDHWLGPMVGALVFTLLPYWLRSLVVWSNVALGAILLAIIIFAPLGIVGTIRATLIQARAARSRVIDPDDPLELGRLRVEGTP